MPPSTCNYTPMIQTKQNIPPNPLLPSIESRGCVAQPVQPVPLHIARIASVPRGHRRIDWLLNEGMDEVLWGRQVLGRSNPTLWMGLEPRQNSTFQSGVPMKPYEKCWIDTPKRNHFLAHKLEGPGRNLIRILRNTKPSNHPVLTPPVWCLDGRFGGSTHPEMV